jgi:DNA-binding CsgD family transcriptional regulator
MKHNQNLLLLDNTRDSSLSDFTDLFVQLLSFTQAHGKQIDGVTESFCREVERLTQGDAWLILREQYSLPEQCVPTSAAISFPVQFSQRPYGMLYIAADAVRPGSPAIPLPIAQLLAQACGMFLHLLEVSALIEGQSRRLDRQIYGNLTNREREVLKLVCQGRTQEEIAAMLHIVPATVETHRKHLCQKLGVHSEHDIPLAAYQAQLLSV